MERIVVSDIDGVVALAEDQPRGSTLTILRELQRHLPLVFVTFRHQDRYLETMAWLSSHELHVRDLIMRKYTGRPVAYKQAVLEGLQQSYEIALYLEDDPGACRIAKDMGIPTVYVPSQEVY